MTTTLGREIAEIEAYAQNPLEHSQIVVLRMLADGLTNTEIAARLFVTPSAVAMRIYRAKQALGSRTTTQAVFEAARRGHLSGRPSASSPRSRSLPAGTPTRRSARSSISPRTG